ncbi:MAG: SDR family oxidoreductase [Acidobacteriota bacterium]
MTTLVVGATGLLGSSICRNLSRRGRPLRALVRPDSPNRSRLASVPADMVGGDLKDEASLAAACRGCGAVITTANTMMTGRGKDSFRTVEAAGQVALLRAAQEAGVNRFIYVSLSPGLPSDSPFVRAKRELEAKVRQSRLAWTILQPTVFMETAFSPAAGWNLERRRVAIIRPGTAPVSYISLEDVADFAVLALGSAAAAQRCLPLGGPEALSPLQAVRIFEESLGRSLSVRLVPAWAPRTMSMIFRPFHPRLASLAALAAAGARGDAVPMRELLESFPVKLTSVAEFASRRLAETRARDHGGTGEQSIHRRREGSDR